MLEWISVKDKFPEESGAYLVCRYHDNPIIDISEYTAHLIKTGFSENHDNEITHWMKLPEAPNA